MEFGEAGGEGVAGAEAESVGGDLSGAGGVAGGVSEADGVVAELGAAREVGGGFEEEGEIVRSGRGFAGVPSLEGEAEDVGEKRALLASDAEEILDFAGLGERQFRVAEGGCEALVKEKAGEFDVGGGADDALMGGEGEVIAGGVEVAGFEFGQAEDGDQRGIVFAAIVGVAQGAERLVEVFFDGVGRSGGGVAGFEAFPIAANAGDLGGGSGAEFEIWIREGGDVPAWGVTNGVGEKGGELVVKAMGVDSEGGGEEFGRDRFGAGALDEGPETIAAIGRARVESPAKEELELSVGELVFARGAGEEGGGGFVEKIDDGKEVAGGGFGVAAGGGVFVGREPDERCERGGVTGEFELAVEIQEAGEKPGRQRRGATGEQLREIGWAQIGAEEMAVAFGREGEDVDRVGVGEAEVGEEGVRFCGVGGGSHRTEARGAGTWRAAEPVIERCGIAGGGAGLAEGEILHAEEVGGGLLEFDGPEIFVVEDQRDRDVELHLESSGEERAVRFMGAEERFGEGAGFGVVAAREDLEAGHARVTPGRARDAFFDDEGRELNGLFVVSALRA